MWLQLVVPVESAKFSANSFRGSYLEKRDADFPLFALQELASRSLDDCSVYESGDTHAVILQKCVLVICGAVIFGIVVVGGRNLVEVKHGDFGCFYLSENLNELMDSRQPAKKTNLEDYLYARPQSWPDAFHQHSAGGSAVYLYNNQNFCFHLGQTVNEAKEQCINPEAFASIGLLESISFHETGSHSGSSNYSMPDLWYVSNKSFGR